MNIIKTGLFLFSVFFLFGCGEKTYTVTEFMEDPSLLTQFNSRCQNGEISQDSDNCKNASTAKHKLQIEKSLSNL